MLNVVKVSTGLRCNSTELGDMKNGVNSLKLKFWNP